MKVSGFTFVENAIKYGYPVTESIRSVLPMVDEMIVCVGDSEDETTMLVESIGSPKIKLVHSVWDSSLKTGGRVLAVETDKALAATAADSVGSFTYRQMKWCMNNITSLSQMPCINIRMIKMLRAYYSTIVIFMAVINMLAMAEGGTAKRFV